MTRYRSTAVSTEGMVASSHPLSTLAGAKVLMKGGNAFDAAIATNAALSVVQPHVCGVGGDAFFLLFNSKTGKVEFLNASGRASRNATISFYKDKGLDQIPARGILAALEVPGCVDGWFEVLDRHGSLPVSDLLGDAIRLAEDGFPISHQLSEAIAIGSSGPYRECDEWLRIYARNGVPAGPGDILVQKDLAWTLKEISKRGRDAFYRGEISRRIVDSMKRHSGLIDEEDLASHTSTWGEPAFTKYRGYTVYETAPNSQAITALMALNILSNFDLESMGLASLEYIRTMIEVSKVAYKYRNSYITDPDEMNISPQEMLDEALSKRDASALKERLSSGPLLKSEYFEGKKREDGDTTYFCTVDKDHNCVSCIQSLYMGFGTGMIPQGTGINLQNRGSYFSLNPNHHNALKPRKRTFHTLCASLTLKNDNPYLICGTMGGDIQPHVHQQIISSVLDFGTDIQQAIEDPRWCKPGTIYEDLETVHLESRFSRKTIEKLRDLGYQIKVEQPLSSSMGTAQGIVLAAETGAIFGGADPRGDGLALGI